MTSEKEQNEADGEVRYFKIGFVGAGGTGKTTVAEILKSNAAVLEPFRPSIVRDTFRQMGIKTEAQQLEMTPDQRWELQRALATAKFAQDQEFQFGLFDRTPIDHFAYGLYRCASVIPDWDFRYVYESVRKYISLYDLIVFFPIYDWGTANVDGFRESTLAYRHAAQALMLGLMDEMRLQWLEMPNEGPQHRADRIVEEINKLRYSPTYKPARDLVAQLEGEREHNEFLLEKTSL